MGKEDPKDLAADNARHDKQNCRFSDGYNRPKYRAHSAGLIGHLEQTPAASSATAQRTSSQIVRICSDRATPACQLPRGNQDHLRVFVTN